MCHPWLAAGVTGVIGFLLLREVGPVLLHARAGQEDRGGGLLGEVLRTWFRNRMEPLVEGLLAAGIRANFVTALQLAISLLCGIAYAGGWIFTAGWLLIAGGTLDVLDGSIARKGGEAGPRGAFVDSVADRYGECAIFFGLAVCFRKGWPLWAVLAAFLGAFMVSYTRARAEGLGVDCRVGLLQRPERYVILGGGSIADSLVTHLGCYAAPGHWVLIASIVVVAALAHVTALQRALFVLRQLP
jgi:CDP-diacylglycerol--glycerol-3-phosphate 3-phosphatidyltransferase